MSRENAAKFFCLYPSYRSYYSEIIQKVFILLNNYSFISLGVLLQRFHHRAFSHCISERRKSCYSETLCAAAGKLRNLSCKNAAKFFCLYSMYFSCYSIIIHITSAFLLQGIFLSLLCPKEKLSWHNIAAAKKLRNLLCEDVAKFFCLYSLYIAHIIQRNYSLFNNNISTIFKIIRHAKCFSVCIYIFFSFFSYWYL